MSQSFVDDVEKANLEEMYQNACADIKRRLAQYKIHGYHYLLEKEINVVLWRLLQDARKYYTES